MNCKQCAKLEIDNEAYNAPSGGFLCRRCYRRLQWKCVAIGIAIAVAGVVASAVFLVMMLLKRWPGGS